MSVPNRSALGAVVVLGLSDDYTVERDELFTTFTYDDSLIGADNVFAFRMVKGMFHVNADGTKVPKAFDAGALFLQFFDGHPMG